MTVTEANTANQPSQSGDRKWVYLFTEGNAKMRDLLGGKGANVAEMTSAGLPVPPGFTITTEACNEYYRLNQQLPPGMWEQVTAALHDVEAKTGKQFGSTENPLLVSVRSGAKFSMPGMMDTVLNLGLTPDTLQGLIKLTGNERFGYDAYRRFIQMFGKIVMGIDPGKFEHVLDEFKERSGAKADTDLTAEQLKQIAEEFKHIFQRETGRDFPTDPQEQLRLAIMAVFKSWNGARAIAYRNAQKIPHDLGTGVNVQTMVFGNMGADSGTGVAFTRNPATGEDRLYGEYLLNAQGEDVVAGTRTPQKIDTLQRELPEVYDQFQQIAKQMERHYRDMQDLEFTVERGKLYMLQTRSGKRTAAAAVKIAVEMVNEGMISKQEAVQRVEPQHVYQLLLPRFDEAAKSTATSEGRLLAKGLNASPGSATGKAIFSADRAAELGKAGQAVILVRQETNPDDVHGFLEARGVLTQRGGATSHAAVVARQLGKPCVAGTEAIRVNDEDALFTVEVNGKTVTVRDGDDISIDGATGEVFLGLIPTSTPDFDNEVELRTILDWSDEYRKLDVWANADYPRDAQIARKFGAHGIGLCRTEHMFFEEERLPIVRRMILAKNQAERDTALAELLPIQREDFIGIFRAMSPYPVIIRLLDPPLHEFLPRYDELLVEVTQLQERGNAGSELHEKENLLHEVESMREQNPMLGLRGCRLGLMFPGLNEMQVRAILEAAIAVKKEGKEVHPEIMIPLVGHANELKVIRDQLEPVVKQVFEEQGESVGYKFGTMIEVPRAAVVADQIAEYAEFFSFGTNDLTQTTFGYSRDDAEGKFLLQYVERKILPENPFQVLDRDGVGALLKMGTERGRAKRPDLSVGICGEHGGDPSSIEFCHMVGLDYVSCSPFRVPVARLAAAQAALTGYEKDK